MAATAGPRAPHQAENDPAGPHGALAPSVPHDRTHSTEYAIARRKLYPFAKKGFTASVGPQDHCRYQGEPAMIGRNAPPRGGGEANS
jgi:hypothetical protein